MVYTTGNMPMRFVLAYAPAEDLACSRKLYVVSTRTARCTDKFNVNTHAMHPEKACDMHHTQRQGIAEQLIALCICRYTHASP